MARTIWSRFYLDAADQTLTTEPPNQDGVGLQMKFFGHFRKGEDTGWDTQPPVQLNIRYYDGSFETRDEREWPVNATDIDVELDRIGHRLSPLEIVAVNTSAGQRYGYDDYVSKGCGIGREATLRLLEQGVRLTGTDAWSWDAPFTYTAQRFASEHDGSIIWEGHKAGREIGYCHIEKLTNLEALPSTGFQVCCFPVKVHAASAGWTRAVAILDQL